MSSCDCQQYSLLHDVARLILFSPTYAESEYCTLCAFNRISRWCIWQEYAWAVATDFIQKVICRYGDLPWLFRFPDLSSAELILLEVPQQEVFQAHPVTILELKNRTRAAVNIIPGYMLRSVVGGFQRRFEEYVVRRSNHFPEVIFKNR